MGHSGHKRFSVREGTKQGRLKAYVSEHTKRLAAVKVLVGKELNHGNKTDFLIGTNNTVVTI